MAVPLVPIMSDIIFWQYQHPGYSVGGGYPNDVCVVRFSTPIQFNDKVQPGLLPDADEDFVGSDCLITGWGRIGEIGFFFPYAQ